MPHDNAPEGAPILHSIVYSSRLKEATQARIRESRKILKETAEIAEGYKPSKWPWLRPTKAKKPRDSE